MQKFFLWRETNILYSLVSSALSQHASLSILWSLVRLCAMAVSIDIRYKPLLACAHECKPNLVVLWPMGQSNKRIQFITNGNDNGAWLIVLNFMPENTRILWSLYISNYENNTAGYLNICTFKINSLDTEFSYKFQFYRRMRHPLTLLITADTNNTKCEKACLSTYIWRCYQIQ